jgi:hypothetical protein
VIIWGTRTKREGRGFVLRPCRRCNTERVQFVAESKSKFTLYFVPTFTTSTKAILVCTECELATEVGGNEGRACIAEAVPQQVMVEELQRRALGQSPGHRAGAQSASESPTRTLAIATIAMAVGAALADGSVDDNEAAAIGHAIKTIADATQSTPVREAAAAASEQFSTLFAYVASPATEPIPVMLGKAGIAARQLAPSDRSRFIGQVAWLCHTVAAAGTIAPQRALDAMDSGMTAMGFQSREIADALAFCNANGG